MEAQRYPLMWPLNVPRTAFRNRAPFKTRGENGLASKTITKATAALQFELDHLLGAQNIVLSTNVPVRLDGLLSGKPGLIQDPGAALYFRRDGVPLCLPCDKWDRVEDNIFAIAKHVEAIRGTERWGVGTLSQAFAGYKALTAGENWWDVLECRPDASRDTIEAQYRARLRAAHPDTGGSHEAMARLNVARNEALSLERTK